VVDPEEIDRLNIFGATMLAMTLAVEALLARIGESKPVREVRVDGNLTPQGRCAQWLWPARAIVGGCDRTVHLGGLDHRQGTPRPPDEGGRPALPALWLGAQRGLWHGAASGGPARPWAHPLHRRSFAPVAQLVLFQT
jgi:ribonuclease HII